MTLAPDLLLKCMELEKDLAAEKQKSIESHERLDDSYRVTIERMGRKLEAAREELAKVTAEKEKLLSDIAEVTEDFMKLEEINNKLHKDVEELEAHCEALYLALKSDDAMSIAFAHELEAYEKMRTEKLK